MGAPFRQAVSQGWIPGKMLMPTSSEAVLHLEVVLIRVIIPRSADCHVNWFWYPLVGVVRGPGASRSWRRALPSIPPARGLGRFTIFLVISLLFLHISTITTLLGCRHVFVGQGVSVCALPSVSTKSDWVHLSDYTDLTCHTRVRTAVRSAGVKL